MHWHPTDDDLVLRYYGEQDADTAARITAHLMTCETCAATSQQIEDVMALTAGVEVPEPNAGFEARMWSRIQPAIAATPSHWSSRSAVFLGALAASLVALVVAGYTWTRVARPVDHEIATSAASALPTTAAPSPRSTSGSDARERVLLAALNDHFAQTEVLLVELLNAPDSAQSELAFERSAADDLVATGRLYRQTARQTGDVRFVNVLEDLESVLVEVARGPEEIDRRDVDFLKTRIRDDALLLKVRAVNAEVRDRQQTLMSHQ